MLKSIKIKDYTFKIDSLRQELEGLSKQSRQYIVEKIKKFNFAIKNPTVASVLNMGIS